MRKALTIIILAFLLSYINCDEEEEENYCDGYCYWKTDPKSLDDCKDLKLDKDEDEEYCCFFNYGGKKNCIPLTEDEYNEYKDVADEMGYQCDNSNYIVISLLSLSLIILLL